MNILIVPILLFTLMAIVLIIQIIKNKKIEKKMNDNKDWSYPTIYDKNLKSVSTTSVSGAETITKQTPSKEITKTNLSSLRIELVKILTPLVYKEHPSYSRDEFAEDVVGLADAILEQLQK